MISKKDRERLKNFTFMQTPETIEVEKLIKYKKIAFYGILFTLTVFSIICILIYCTVEDKMVHNVFQTIMIVSIILTVIVYFVSIILMQPYYDLLKLARLNDRVRHEERLRIRERERHMEQNLPPRPPKPKN